MQPRGQETKANTAATGEARGQQRSSLEKDGEGHDFSGVTKQQIKLAASAAEKQPAQKMPVWGAHSCSPLLILLLNLDLSS
jgi:hypothetical protein